jgi:FixJ family two-component response regulator
MPYFNRASAVNLQTPHAGHVIVIDDDEAIRRSLFNLLSREGYLVCLHASADDFLAVNQPPQPSVLLCDMRMPGLTGVELQTALRERGYQMPVVFVSGDSRPEEIITAMKHGAVDFLLKPFSSHALIDAIAKAMQLAQKIIVEADRQTEVEQRLRRLTPREMAVCYWMVRGYSNQQISQIDGAAAATIKLHRARVMDKMQAVSLPELIAMLSGMTLPEPARSKADEQPVQG